MHFVYPLRSGRGRPGTVPLALAALAFVVPAAADGATGGASPGGSGDGRLQGTFTMDGRVTVAHNVRGEHAGQPVRRAWTFGSTCASGACPTVSLRRQRGSRSADRLTLRRRSPGLYSGQGVFYQALVCHRRRYPRGGRVPFTVTVRVTATRTVQDVPFATAVRATYVNRRRENLTRCSGLLGHDSARYTGAVRAVPAPPQASFTSRQEAPASPIVEFADTSKPGAAGGALTGRRWSFGDPSSGAANSSTSAKPSHRFSGPGSYTVSLRVRDANGLVSTITHDVTVPAAP
jgi:hypothetical protein